MINVTLKFPTEKANYIKRTRTLTPNVAYDHKIISS